MRCHRGQAFKFAGTLALLTLLVAASQQEVQAQAPPRESAQAPYQAEPYGHPATFPAVEPVAETVHVEAGTRLWSRPDARAESVVRVDAPIDLTVLEKIPGWVKVRYAGRVGWLPSAGDQSPTGQSITRLAANPARLDRARQLLGIDGPTGRCGPFPVYTDVQDPALLIELSRVASSVSRAYQERYGLSAGGDPVEAVVLFRRVEDFRAFARSETSLGGLQVAGFARDGLAVIYRGSQTDEDIEHDLVHEIVHLLNRRVFGLSLPPWLEEGVANDLGFSRIRADGSLVLNSLSGDRLERQIGHYEAGGWLSIDKQIRERGAVASLARLARLAKTGQLPPVSGLTRATWQDFTAEVGRQQRYDEAMFLVRFLLDPEHPVVRTRFLTSLRRFAEDPAANFSELNPATWPGVVPLSERFGRWLVDQQERVPSTPDDAE